MNRRTYTATLRNIILGVFLLSLFCADVASARSITEIRERIATDRRSERLHAELAEAYLVQGKSTGAAEDFVLARFYGQRALNLNERSYHALRALAWTSSASHRFAEAMEWVERGLKIASNDPALIAVKMECLIATDQLDAARALLEADQRQEYYIVFMRGYLARIEGKVDEAASLYAEAADIAGKQGLQDIEAHTSILTAGVYIDNGRHLEALPFLDRAQKLEPDNFKLAIHRAEVLEGEGEIEAAYTSYKELLKEQQLTSLYIKLFELAQGLGLKEEAERYFYEAEVRLHLPLDAGEVYTLGGLAELYLAGERNLEKALDLAERNLQYVKSPDAKQLVAELRRRTGKH